MTIMTYAPPIVACVFAGLGALMAGFGNDDERGAGYVLIASSIVLFLITFLCGGAR